MTLRLSQLRLKPSKNYRSVVWILTIRLSSFDCRSVIEIFTGDLRLSGCPLQDLRSNKEVKRCDTDDGKLDGSVIEDEEGDSNGHSSTCHWHTPPDKWVIEEGVCLGHIKCSAGELYYIYRR